MTTPNFTTELETAINKWSKENGSNTPDFILAKFLSVVLGAFDTAVCERANWYGHMDRPGQSKEADAPLQPTMRVCKCRHVERVHDKNGCMACACVCLEFVPDAEPSRSSESGARDYLREVVRQSSAADPAHDLLTLCTQVDNIIIGLRQRVVAAEQIAEQAQKRVRLMKSITDNLSKVLAGETAPWTPTLNNDRS